MSGARILIAERRRGKSRWTSGRILIIGGLIITNGLA